MKDDINEYLESLLPASEGLLAEMEEYAKENQVPIMEPAGMQALSAMLMLQKPAHLLEIGTAIGYSALRMLKAVPDLHITTIERDEERYHKALEYIGRSGFKNQIKVLFGDALLLEEAAKENGPFDAIFIDAAKGQYQRFFELYAPMLTRNGVIYSDNVLFKGYTAGVEAPSKRLEKLAGKIGGYNKWLMDHSFFETAIIPAGDGIAISIKRGEQK